MTDEHALQVWKPSEFEGSDLLPVPTEDSVLAPEEELVGQENILQEDMILPVLSLLHGMSEPVTKGVDGAKVGLFHLSLGDKIFEPPLRVLLVHHCKGAAMFPDDKREKDPEVKCLSRDGITGTHFGNCDQCGRSEFGKDRSKPICAKSHNFVLMTQFGMAIFRCRVTNYKTANMFVTEWKHADPERNMWHHPLMITTRQESYNLGGKTVMYPVLDLHWLTKETIPPDVRAECNATFEKIAAAHDKGKLGGDTEE